MRGLARWSVVALVACTATPTHPPILETLPDSGTDAGAADATLAEGGIDGSPDATVDGAIDAGPVLPPWEGDAAGFLPWAEARPPTPLGISMGPSGDVFDVGLSGGSSGAGYLHAHDFWGASLWNATVPKGAGTANITAVAALSAGHVVVGGTFTGPLDLGAGPTQALGASGIYVAEFDAKGSVVWSRAFAADGRVTAIAVDGVGGVALAGSFTGTFALAPDAGASARTYYVARLDAGHNPIFTRLVPGVFTFEIRSTDVAFDPSGALYAVFGVAAASVDLGTGPIPGQGRAMVVAKFSSNGNAVWARAFSSLGLIADFGAFRQSVAVSKTGRVYVATTTADVITSECGTVAPSTKDINDVFVAELDPLLGTCTRATMIAGAGPQTLGHMSVDGSGTLHVAGWSNGAIDVGGQITPTAGDTDGFLARFDPNLGLLGVSVYGDAMAQSLTTVSAVGPGYRAVLGSTTGSVTIAGSTLSGPTGFVAVLPP